MIRLCELQQRFSDAIRSDTDTNRLPAAAGGLRIYRNNYRAQLRAALRDSYPHLRLWLGDSQFDAAADAHIARSLPTGWTLDDYGHDFPVTLRALFPNDAEVWELAWLDFAMAQAFVAKDEDPVGVDDLADIDWDSARITFASSVGLSEASSNAADIWSALEEQLPPPLAASLPERSAHLVWRRALVPHFRLISISEYQVISSLHIGFSFADTCEILRMQMADDEAIAAAAAMLGRWLHDGLIANVETPSVHRARV